MIVHFYFSLLISVTRVNEEDEMQFYSKIWFILICLVIAVIVLVILVATIAALRWRSIHKGNKFTSEFCQVFEWNF